MAYILSPEFCHTLYFGASEFIKSQNFSEQKRMWGWNPENQANKLGMTTQHFHIMPKSCAILPWVGCVHERVVEGSGLGSAGCAVQVHVHREWVVLWSAQAVLSLYGMLECVCC